MPLFLVCYDLRKPNYKESDSQDLYRELDWFDAKPIQDSVWAIRENSTSAEIFNKLRPHMHKKDRLLVTKLSGFQNIHGITALKSV